MPDCLPRVGSALLVRNEANQILLGKRNKDPQRGNWVIPGGKIHAFESIAEAAVRELREQEPRRGEGRGNGAVRDGVAVALVEAPEEEAHA